jgi:hypothetical protein
MCIHLIVARQRLSKLFVYLFVANQRIGKHIPAATNTSNNIRTVGRECMDLSMYPPVAAK